MRTDISAGLQAVLSGGQIYWLTIITPHASDTWTAIATGNLDTYSLSGYSVWTNRLVEIGDINQSLSGGHLWENPITTIPDVDLTIQNFDDTIDSSLYIGRKIEIRMGYGGTMSIATSDVVFTGKIQSIKSNNRKLIFNCQGNTKLWDKEVGVKLPDTVHEKYRGKIYPITHGAWTDDYAYAPTILNRPTKDIPALLLSNRDNYQIDAARIYDSETESNLDINLANMLIPSGNRIIYPSVDTLCRVSFKIYEWCASKLWSIQITNKNNLTYEESLPDTIPKPCVISVDDELMLVWKKPSETIEDYVMVERGYAGTKIAAHEIDSIVYQIETDHAAYGFKVNNIFYADGVSGMKKADTFYYGSHNDSGDFNSLKTIDGYYRHTMAIDRLAWEAYHDFIGCWMFNLRFKKTSITGTVTNQYLIAKININCTGGTDYPSHKMRCHIAVVKDNSFSVYYGFDSSDNFDLSGDSPKIVNFNNINGTDAQTDIPMTNDFLLSDVSELNDLSMSMFYQIDNHFWGGGVMIGSVITVDLYRIGLRLDFVVNPEKYDFYMVCKGRKNPGGYFNGSSGNLMENPSSIVEDFIRNEVPGMSSASIDETSFDSAYSARADWKLATTLYVK